MIKLLKSLGLLSSAIGLIWYVYSFVWVVPTQGPPWYWILTGEIINGLTIYLVLGQIGRVLNSINFVFENKWLNAIFNNKFAESQSYVIAVLILQLWYPWMLVTQDMKGVWGHAVFYSIIDALTYFYVLNIISSWVLWCKK